MAYQRTNAHIAETLAAVAEMMAQNNADRIAQTNRMGGEEELRWERFMKNNPPIFKGGYDPDGAQNWIEGVERIFGAM
ncbi:cellular nucleic acid-binding protein, partial [Trifolium medium]|nr:cellular nucleic acid-binding protein [Trifolium medium]